MIHGPGNKGNLNLLYKLVQKGSPWPLGAFENKRSFTSIDNLTFIIDQIIEKDIDPINSHSPKSEINDLENSKKINQILGKNWR